jgi:ribosome maturation protein Sdo1
MIKELKEVLLVELDGVKLEVVIDHGDQSWTISDMGESGLVFRGMVSKPTKMKAIIEIMEYAVTVVMDRLKEVEKSNTEQKFSRLWNAQQQ